MIASPSRITSSGEEADAPHASRVEKGPGGGAHPSSQRGHAGASFGRARAAVRRAALARRITKARGGVEHARSGVQRLVDEPVGELVELPPDGGVRHGSELASEARRLTRKRPECSALDLALAAYLLG